MSLFHPTLLSNRCIIEATGKDVRKLLQSLLTCNVDELTKEHNIAYGFLLTPQGRFLHELFVIWQPDGFFLDTGLDQAEQFLKRLKMYTLKSDATFTVFEEWSVLASVEPMMPSDKAVTVKDPRHENLGYRSYDNKALLENLADDAHPNYQDYRVALGIPSAEDFVPEKTLLLDYNVDDLNGVDFDKGCFVGQEVTARMHYRGVDKKGLYLVAAEKPLTPHSVLHTSDKEAGRLLSVAGTNGLAMLRHEYAGEPITTGQDVVTVSRPQWITSKEAS